MKMKGFILLNCIVLAIDLSAQCPQQDFLWKRLIFLRDSYQISNTQKLQELLPYEAATKNCPFYNDSTNVLLQQRIGMAYFGLFDYLRAIQHLKEAIKIANIRPVNRKYNIWNYFYLSAAYDSLKNGVEKMKAVDSCISVAMKLNAGSDIACLYSLYSRMEYYYDIGDYYNCIEYAKTCEKFALQYAKQDAYRGKSFASSSLGWNIEAMLRLKDFKSAEELLTNKLKEYQKNGLQNYFGITYDQLAHVQISKGNFENALSLLQLALYNNRKSGYDFNCKQIENTIGYEIFFSHLNNYDKALQHYRLALKCINKDKSFGLKDTIESLNILNRMANVYVKEKKFDLAFKNFQSAFDLLQPNSNESNILIAAKNKFSVYKKINYLSGLIIDKGDAFEKVYLATGNAESLNQAIKVYKAAEDFLNSIKTDLSDLQSKLFWRNDSRRLYENAIEACYLARDYADAFYFFEKSRAVLLNDQLVEHRWLGESEIMRQTQLKKKVLRIETELNSLSMTSANYSGVQDNLFNSKRELEELQEFIKTNNPLYYQNFVDKKFININDVKRTILKEHEGLIEVFNGDSAIYVLVITSERSYLEKVNKTVFDNLSAKYVRYIADPVALNSNFEDYKKSAFQLFALLFQNITLPHGRLVISPDGKYFPFEALITNTNRFTYFLEDYAVSYTYSARFLINDFNAPSEARKIFMGIAPVNFAGFPDLIGSDQSLKNLQQYFSHSISYVGTKATRNNFLNEFYKYKIIQLYTHATDSGNGGEPVIYFSDTTLALSDLLPEKKPVSNLIVLSACQTASGRLYSGEGVFSFNRSFAALGIPSTVSNLWQANDQATYRITELFYKYIADGLPLDVALQQAKKDFIKSNGLTEFKLPSYWASAILIGKTEAIIIPKHFDWKWTAVLLIVALILCVWILVSKIRRVRYYAGLKEHSFKMRRQFFQKEGDYL